MRINAQYYQQFDADHTREVPGEGYGGWQQAEIEIEPARTAVVSMHAWDFDRYETYPGWWRAVEYIPRSLEICRTVFPPLLAAVRASELQLFHVVSSSDYCATYPGYQRAVALAGEAPAAPEAIAGDASLEALRAFKREHVFVGPHNVADVNRGFEHLDFPAEARPQGDEGIAKDAHQLFALCREARINHLIYIGFAINWCLLKSPGGMVDMSRRGFMCSAVRQAVTAVENRETARAELAKDLALWRVALAFGFVFDADDLVDALR